MRRETPPMPKSTFTPAYALLLERLRTLRREAGVSQVELAQRLGKNQAFVSTAERGIRRVDLIEFYAIVRALGGDPVATFAELAARLPPNVSI
jgi:transcriptional regulator with XRE-family HTH domain